MRSKCRCSCVLQFTFRRAVSCVLHRPPSQVIHCTVLCFKHCGAEAPDLPSKRFQAADIPSPGWATVKLGLHLHLSLGEDAYVVRPHQGEHPSHQRAEETRFRPTEHGVSGRRQTGPHPESSRQAEPGQRKARPRQESQVWFNFTPLQGQQGNR